LDSPPNAAGIHLEAPLGKHLSYVLVSQRISHNHRTANRITSPE
jgi:hypothetical protein